MIPLTAMISNDSTRRSGHRLAIGLGTAALLLLAVSSIALACPFCSGLLPTLTERREESRLAAIAEVQHATGHKLQVVLHRALPGSEPLGDLHQVQVAGTEQIKPGTLVVALARGDRQAALADLDWSVVPANEAVLAYWVKAPSRRVPAVERLRYFARYLEHADPQIAADAYHEFGQAPYDDVAQVADAFDARQLQTWLDDAQVPQERKGFYAMALALAGPATDKPAHLDFLRRRVEQPASGLEAGLDGLIGGYLLLGGTEALDNLDRHYLLNQKCGDAQVRHALAALRFQFEFGRNIPADRLKLSMRLLLDRPEFATAALVDLARWQDWAVVDRVVALYRPQTEGEFGIRRAVVGYLKAAPAAIGEGPLATLRRQDPQGVAAAEASLQRFNALQQPDR